MCISCPVLMRCVLCCALACAAGGVVAVVVSPAVGEEACIAFDHAANPPAWQARNAHLIPDDIENEAILDLDQDDDGIPCRTDPDSDNDGVVDEADPDIDNDGIANLTDPSPFDWREPGYNPFGVLAFLNWDHAWNSSMYEGNRLERAVALLAESGVGMVRMDFSWDDIESEQGVFEFDRYDRIVALLARHNIRILGIASYCSRWAGACWNGPPDRNEDFVAYFSAVVRRYRGRVKYWEIWNEPDSRVYWAEQDRMVRYTGLLVDCFQAAKEIEPSCRILIGGLTERLTVALKNIYRNGGGDCFDIVNIHPFVDPLKPGAFSSLRGIVRGVRKVMAEFNDADKTLWCTELGCPGVRAPNRGNGWWMGMSPTEKQQAAWAARVFTDGIMLEGVEKIFWAFFQDTADHFGNGVDSFGLVRGDFSRKPSFSAMRNAVRLWRAADEPLENNGAAAE